MIAFACSGCGKSLRVHEDMGGKRAKCPQCGQALRVPSAAEDLATLPPKSAAGRPVDRPTVAADRASAAPHRPAAGASGDTVAGRQPGGPGARSELTEFLAPPQAPDELGRLGPYRVLKVLGAGGMGVVYEAEDPQLQRKVALKAMLPSLGASSAARERFQREARAAAAIEHDHIVHIYQVGEDRGVPYLAMQFLHGEPLDERLKRDGKLPVPEVMRIGRETAEGLAAAHRQGLIHRDIKPANLWLEGERRRVKILDFGLARSAGADSQLTQQGAIVGTPAYMAPEQAAGQAVDARTDLFSLGCVLYRLCSGDMAFKGSDTISTLVAVATVHPRPPHELRPELPRPLSDLVMRLLAKKPDQRPPSARAVADALAALERHDLTAVPPARAPKTKPKAAPSSTARIRASRAAPRRRTPLVVGTALGVVLLAVAGFLLVSAFNRAPTPIPPALTTNPESRPSVVAKAAKGPSFFNGRDLAGWKGLPDFWHVRDGAIVGAVPPGQKPVHTFLCSQRTYRDFDLKFRVRLKDGLGNSGLQFRSRLSDPAKFKVVGPQCEICGNPGLMSFPAGSLFTEPVGKPAVAATTKVFMDTDFNDFHIRCVGRHVLIQVNGLTTVDVAFPSLPDEGILAWQMHGGRPPRELTIKDIEFSDLSSRRWFGE